jgi:hypothetical protein
MRPAHKLAVTAALLFVSGLALMFWDYRTIQRWQSAVARVTYSELIPFTAGGKTRYRGELELRYVARDTVFRVPYSVPASSKSMDAAKEDLMRYRIGSTTTVFLNPDNPLDFLVESRSSPRFFFLPAGMIGAGVILGSISVLLFSSMQRWLCPDCATSVALHHKFCFACGRKLPRAKKWVSS